MVTLIKSIQIFKVTLFKICKESNFQIKDLIQINSTIKGDKQIQVNWTTQTS